MNLWSPISYQLLYQREAAVYNKMKFFKHFCALLLITMCIMVALVDKTEGKWVDIVRTEPPLGGAFITVKNKSCPEGEIRIGKRCRPYTR